MEQGQTLSLLALSEWAERIGLTLSEVELPQVAAEIAAGRAAMAALWAVDLGSLEPIVTFDTDYYL
jgi:uncharacterized small protein (DUF1192 family)